MFEREVVTDENAAPANKNVALTIDVLDPAGVQTTIQDYPGRLGYWNIGVPPSGPMDGLAFRVANRLVGNAEGLPAMAGHGEDIDHRPLDLLAPHDLRGVLHQEEGRLDVDVHDA
ncbi:MAG: hypothetical protein J0I90_08900, partial [Nitrosospira sp.]|nr:hypothetical protein [Nitrosospira sp.]